MPTANPNDLLRVQPDDDGEVRHLTASEWREVLHQIFIWMIDTSKDADAHSQSPMDVLTEALANVGKDYGLVADERGEVFKFVFNLWFNAAPEGRTYLEFFRSIATGPRPSRATAERAFALMVGLGSARRFRAVLKYYGIDPDKFLQRVADRVLTDPRTRIPRVEGRNRPAR